MLNIDLPKSYLVLQRCQDFLHETDDECHDLVVTSPPYNIGKEYEVGHRDFREYLAEQEWVIRQLVRTLKDGGSICWQVGNYVSKGEVYPLDCWFYKIFHDLGLKCRNRIVWHFRGTGLQCTRRFTGTHETILWFTKGDDYKFNLDAVRVPRRYPDAKKYKGPKKGEPLGSNPLGKNPADVWDIPVVKHAHVEKTEHPCQFPVALAERLVLALTDPGDAVCDPYMGSGSTAIAALVNGREAYGCEKEAKYHGIMMDRVEQLRQGRLVTRPLLKPTQEPPKPKDTPQALL